MNTLFATDLNNTPSIDLLAKENLLFMTRKSIKRYKCIPYNSFIRCINKITITINYSQPETILYAEELKLIKLVLLIT